MKALVKILLGAFLVFEVVAILQEWPLFAAAWLGIGPGTTGAPPLTAEARQGAEAALRQFHAIARHLYATSGDPRFTDRLPASPEVADELLADVAYLQHNGLAQEGTLVRLDVVGARAADERTVFLDTREYWVVRVLRADDRQPIEPPHSLLFEGRYRLRKEGVAWRVETWDRNAEARPPEGRDGGR